MPEHPSYPPEWQPGRWLAHPKHEDGAWRVGVITPGGFRSRKYGQWEGVYEDSYPTEAAAAIDCAKLQELFDDYPDQRKSRPKGQRAPKSKPLASAAPKRTEESFSLK